MRRREFLGALISGAAARPMTARAEQQMPVIGYLSGRTPDGDKVYVTAFRNGLAELGLEHGRNVTIEGRWAAGKHDQFPALATDLIGRHVAVILASGTATGMVVKAATATIPIVFVTADDPVEVGLVNSLNRPIGNLTGISMVSSELRPKMVELLRQLMPQATTIVMLANPNNSSVATQTRETQAAVTAAQLQFEILKASAPTEIETAFATLSRQPGMALVVSSDPFLTGQHKQIVEMAARYSLPAVSVARICG